MPCVGDATADRGTGGPKERPATRGCEWEGAPGAGAPLLLVCTNWLIARNAPQPDGAYLSRCLGGTMQWLEGTPGAALGSPRACASTILSLGLLADP